MVVVYRSTPRTEKHGPGLASWPSTCPAWTRDLRDRPRRYPPGDVTHSSCSKSLYPGMLVVGTSIDDRVFGRCVPDCCPGRGPSGSRSSEPWDRRPGMADENLCPLRGSGHFACPSGVCRFEPRPPRSKSAPQTRGIFMFMPSSVSAGAASRLPTALAYLVPS